MLHEERARQIIEDSDSAIYDALVRMAQPFSMGLTLVDALDTMLAWEEKEKPVPTVVPVEGQATVADSTASNEDASGEDDDKLYLKRVTVEGDVRARMVNDDQPVFAFADKMTGDEQQVELFGSDKRPSQVMLDAGILAGDHLVFTLNDQNLHVIGKGTLSFLSHPIDEETGEVIADNGLTKPVCFFYFF